MCGVGCGGLVAGLAGSACQLGGLLRVGGGEFGQSFRPIVSWGT